MDCFAFHRRASGATRCQATHYTPCPESCGFYKTMPEYMDDHDRAVIRLNSLPEKQANKIFDRYGKSAFLTHRKV